MASWEEVDVLMKQFQAVQKSSTKQKLSERNVIELVSKLVDLGLIEVVYTVDGKEYLTQEEISKEIKEELFVQGGRVALTELAQILNLDYSHVEARAQDVLKSDRTISLVLGNLIDKKYLDSLAEEVNDKLQEKGILTILELTSQYDLPADFLTSSLQSRIGHIIKGQFDSYDRNVIYTNAFILRIKGQIRGALSAVTRPVFLQSILQRHKLHERIFYSVLEELVKQNRLPGSVDGIRQEKGVYIPDIYAKSQNEWVDNFYRQNGYLEYDALVRQGISDPKSFIKKRYKTEKLIYLSSCCVGQSIQENLEAYVEDALSSGSWIDVMPFVPSIFSVSDASELLNQCIKKYPNAIVCADTIVASDKIISEVSKPFPDLMAVKAEMDAKTHPAFRFNEAVNVKGVGGGNTKEDKKEQRRKKAASGQKSGGGTQGRESKSKSLKKKGARVRDDDSDDEGATSNPKSRNIEIEFMTSEEIEDVIRKNTALEDAPDELIQEIAEQLHGPLTKQYQEVAKSVFLQSAGVASGSSRKKTHDQLQEKITGLWTNAKLFEKGLQLLPDETQTLLIRHLLKTVCTDMMNLVLNAIATDHMMSTEEDKQHTNESRAKLISKLPGEVQRVLNSLNTSLNGKTLDEFFEGIEVVCNPQHLGILLRKLDKKKEKHVFIVKELFLKSLLSQCVIFCDQIKDDPAMALHLAFVLLYQKFTTRQVIFSHRAMLCEQIKEEQDPAMTLHLACVILFQKFTQCMIHLPGKCVPSVLMFLKDHLEKESFDELTLLQDYVIAQIQKQTEGAGGTETLDISITMEKVKDIALNTKKSVQSKSVSED